MDNFLEEHYMDLNNSSEDNSKVVVNSKLNLGALLGFVFAVSTLLFLLLGTVHNVLSLSTVLNWESHLTGYEQIIIIALIPIYLAILLFCASVLGVTIGHFLQKK